QVCTSAERFYVVGKAFDGFVDRFVGFAKTLRIGDPLGPDVDLGPMVSAEQRAKVEQKIADSVAAGARLVAGGRRPDRMAKGFFYEPTVLLDVTASMPLMREETFGPVAPIVRCRDIDEAIALADRSEYGLGASIYTNNLEHAMKAMEQVHAGTFWINDPLTAHDFGKEIPSVALTISVTLAFRPVGAFLFGLLADRYGRRLPLMLDLIFFSIVEVLSGLAPNFTTFFILRALFGIGMGAEWGVGASLAMEKVPPRWRGVLSGFLQEGYAVGYLLAGACSFFVFPRWGWRPMFFIGGLPALLAVFVRFRVKESEVWEKTRHESWSQLGRGIAAQWRLFLYLTMLMMMMNFVSHGTQD